MSESNKENIFRELNYFTLALNTDIKVLIIGGGKAAYIKARSLRKKGVKPTLIAQDFIKEILEFDDLTLIRNTYYKKILEKFHLIIIAIDNQVVKEEIITHCNESYKVYIDCSSYKNGLAIMQSQNDLNNISYSLNTKVGAPKLSTLLLGEMESYLKPYDDFVALIGEIRNRAKELDRSTKSKIIDFICSKDFKFFYDKGVHGEVIEMFFNEEIRDILLRT